MRTKLMSVSLALVAGLLASSHGVSVGAQQGTIKVHGHWTIDIRNPDGQVVAHREFHNALSGDGASALVAWLAGTSTPGPLAVVVDSSVNHPCEVPGYHTPKGCYIVPPDWERFSYPAYCPCFRNLTRTEEPGVAWSGQATADQDSQIDTVSTFVGLCTADTSPANCVNPLDIRSFTGTTIAPIPVAEGQIIQVKVTLSFS